MNGDFPQPHIGVEMGWWIDRYIMSWRAYGAINFDKPNSNVDTTTISLKTFDESFIVFLRNQTYEWWTLMNSSHV